MAEQLVSYFSAERSESAVFMAVGLAAIFASIYLWRYGGSFKAMAWPLAAIAAIQIVVGATVFFRTPAQVETLQEQYSSNRAKFRFEEKQRMDQVVANFRIYRWIEIALLAVGVLLVVVFKRGDAGFAVGLGLAIQSALMLVLDYFAERRADEYLRFILGSAS